MTMEIRNMVARLGHRLTLVIGRGRISQSDDSGPIQMVQAVLNAKETPDVRRVGEFGIASWPPDGTDGILVFIMGDRSNGAVIATHDLKSRFKMGNKGESALFSATTGGAADKWVWLKKDDGIEVQANDEPVVVNGAKSVTVNAGEDGITLNVQGNVTINLNGKNLTLNNPGTVTLGPGGKKVVVDGDPVSGGVVHASQSVVKA